MKASGGNEGNRTLSGQVKEMHWGDTLLYFSLWDNYWLLSSIYHGGWAENNSAFGSLRGCGRKGWQPGLEGQDPEQSSVAEKLLFPLNQSPVPTLCGTEGQKWRRKQTARGTAQGRAFSRLMGLRTQKSEFISYREGGSLIITPSFR